MSHGGRGVEEICRREALREGIRGEGVEWRGGCMRESGEEGI